MTVRGGKQDLLEKMVTTALTSGSCWRNTHDWLSRPKTSASNEKIQIQPSPMTLGFLKTTTILKVRPASFCCSLSTPYHFCICTRNLWMKTLELKKSCMKKKLEGRDADYDKCSTIWRDSGQKVSVHAR